MTDVTDVPYEDVLDEFLVEDAELAADCLAQALDDDESPGVIAIAIDDLVRAGYTIVLSGPARPPATKAPAKARPAGPGGKTMRGIPHEEAMAELLAEDAELAAGCLRDALRDDQPEVIAIVLAHLKRAGYTLTLSRAAPAKAKARHLAASAKAKRPAPAAKRGVVSAKAKRPAATTKVKAAQTPARPRRPAAPATRRAASAAAAAAL